MCLSCLGYAFLFPCRYASYAAQPSQTYGQSAQVRLHKRSCFGVHVRVCNANTLSICIVAQACGFLFFQQGYGQQNYGSYTQPAAAAADSSYTQTTPAAAGYPQQQQQYGSTYGQQPASQWFLFFCITLFCLHLASNPHKVGGKSAYSLVAVCIG